MAVIVDRELFARAWAKDIGLSGHPDAIDEGRMVFDLTREIQELQAMEEEARISAYEARKQQELFERSGESWWDE